jgi:hypothetical protein
MATVASGQINPTFRRTANRSYQFCLGQIHCRRAGIACTFVAFGISHDDHSNNDVVNNYKVVMDEKLF